MNTHEPRCPRCNRWRCVVVIEGGKKLRCNQCGIEWKPTKPATLNDDSAA